MITLAVLGLSLYLSVKYFDKAEKWMNNIFK